MAPHPAHYKDLPVSCKRCRNSICNTSLDASPIRDQDGWDSPEPPQAALLNKGLHWVEKGERKEREREMFTGRTQLSPTEDLVSWIWTLSSEAP